MLILLSLVRTYRVRGIEFKVLLGDITRIECEAIVNPANSLMIMGGGVAGAIKRAGGEEVEREAMSKAPVRVGDAIITGAGRLKAKYVIHAPTMERPAMRISVDNVEKAVRAALRKMVEAGIREAAFPGMGTGVGGVNPREAARVMIETILRELEGKEGYRIILVAFNQELYDAFKQALEKAGAG